VNYRPGLAFVGDIAPLKAASNPFGDPVRQSERGSKRFCALSTVDLAGHLSSAAVASSEG
jgi:hypothetical protein